MGKRTVETRGNVRLLTHDAMLLFGQRNDDQLRAGDGLFAARKVETCLIFAQVRNHVSA